MMDSPEGRVPMSAPWLFGRQGLGVLILVTLVAATFLATDVTFLAGALLLLGLAAQGWAVLALTHVEYSRQTSRPRAFCGDELVLESTLTNPRPLPLPWVEVWEHLPLNLGPEGSNERSFVDADRIWVNRGLALWPYQRLRWRRRLSCRHRGVFQLGQTRVRSGDPFGFFERERVWQDHAEMLVYPRLVPLRRLGLPLHHPALDVASRTSPVTDPTRTATVREYRPDDPRRMIHWPTTARRGTLQVRVLEPATSLHVTLLLDVGGFPFGIYRHQLLELTLSALASIAVFLHSQGAPVALLANADPPLVVPPGASVAHLESVLEHLARLEPRPGRSLLPWALTGADLPRGNTVVLATSDVAVERDMNVAQLRQAGFRILTLLAMAQARAGRRDSGTISITSGCDLGAVLEGRA